MTLHHVMLENILDPSMTLPIFMRYLDIKIHPDYINVVKICKYFFIHYLGITIHPHHTAVVKISQKMYCWFALYYLFM